jgi:hypothetical protein
MHRDTPLTQLWVISSSHMLTRPVWWKPFLKMVQQGTGPLYVPIFRGTHFAPVDGSGGADGITSRSEALATLKEFDAGVEFVMDAMTSWTKRPEIALEFANNVKTVIPGWTHDGYVHVIASPGKVFDVETAYKREKHKWVEYGSWKNTHLVPEREKEVILPPGVVLVPVGRVSHWMVWRRQ